MTVLKDYASCTCEFSNTPFAIAFASHANDKTFTAIARSFLCERQRRPCSAAGLGITLDVAGHRCRVRARRG